MVVLFSAKNNKKRLSVPFMRPIFRLDRAGVDDLARLTSKFAEAIKQDPLA